MQTPTTNRIQAVGLAALLLTAAAGAGAKAPHSAKTPHKGQAVTDTKTIALSGRIDGTWRQRPPDAGGGYDLSGVGALAPLGQVRAAGALPGPGARAHGPAPDTFTLTAPTGTLTLALSGAAPPAPAQTLPAAASLPAQAAPAAPIAFTVVGGTGAFAGKHGAGTAHLSMTPQRRPAVVPGRPTPHFIVAAMFTLTFGDAGQAAPDTAEAPPAPQ